MPLLLSHLLAGIVGLNPGGLMFLSCECRVSSERGLCIGLITRPEESYGVWCVNSVITALILRRPWSTGGFRTIKKVIWVFYVPVAHLHISLMMMMMMMIKVWIILISFKVFVPCIFSAYGVKTKWCQYFIRILLDLYMFRAHRPIFRRVHTAVRTTIGSIDKTPNYRGF